LGWGSFALAIGNNEKLMQNHKTGFGFWSFCKLGFQNGHFYSNGRQFFNFQWQAFLKIWKIQRFLKNLGKKSQVT